MVKALKINAANKTIVEVEKGEGIQDIYKHVGCQSFEVVPIGYPDEVASIYVDEEALCKEAYIDEDGVKHGMHGFHVENWPHLVIGNGLVMGFDPETGDSGDCPLSIEELQKVITFVEFDRPQDRPSPQCGFVSW